MRESVHRLESLGRPGRAFVGVGHGGPYPRRLLELVAVCDMSLNASQKFLDDTAAWERTKNMPKARGEGEAVALDPILDKVPRRQ